MKVMQFRALKHDQLLIDFICCVTYRALWITFNRVRCISYCIQLLQYLLILSLLRAANAEAQHYNEHK